MHTTTYPCKVRAPKEGSSRALHVKWKARLLNKKEDAWDRAHPGRGKQRAERNKARAEAVKAGVISKHSPKQIDHIKPLSKGGSNVRSNTRAISAHANESYRRNADGSIKGKRG